MDNFDSEIETDLQIAGLKQLGGLSDCKFEGKDHLQEPHFQPEVGGIPVGPADSPPTLHYRFYYETTTGDHVTGVDPSYRITCNKVPPLSEIRLSLAVVKIRKPYKVDGTSLFDTARIAKWVSVSSKFETRGRARVEKIKECITDRTCKSRGLGLGGVLDFGR